MSLVVTYWADKKPDTLCVRRSDWPKYYHVTMPAARLAGLLFTMKLIGITCLEKKS